MLLLTYVVSLVELATSKILEEPLDAGGAVDDNDTIVTSAMSEGGGDHTYLYLLQGARRVLGPLHGHSTLGKARCKLLTFARTTR